MLSVIGVILAIGFGLLCLGIVIQYWMVIAATVVGGIIFGPIGGIIGFFIGVAIKGAMASQQENDQHQRPRQTSRQHQKQPHQPRSHQHQHTAEPQITIQSLVPIIALVSYFCLRKDNQWTSEKVKFVKSLFEEACENPADVQLLQQVMKEKSYHEDQLIRQILAMQPDYALRHKVFVSCATGLLYDDFSDASLDKLLSKLGQQLNLRRTDYSAIIESLKTHSSDEQYSHHQRHTGSHSGSQDQVAWAYGILGLTRQATQSDIKKAFRQKMAQYHPDKNQNVTLEVQQLLNEKTVELQKARDIVMSAV